MREGKCHVTLTKLNGSLCLGQTNSRTMLLPLLQQYSSRMRVSLYHTPDLRGLLRLLVPQRFNETIGVQHIKAYLFDDDLIISGYTHTVVGGGFVIQLMLLGIPLSTCLFHVSRRSVGPT